MKKLAKKLKETFVNSYKRYREFRQTRLFVFLGLMVFFSISSITFSIVSTVYALNTYATGFQIGTESKQIYYGSAETCKKVTNTSGNTYFIPTKTAAEWDSFYSHPPAGIAISGCDCESSATFGSGDTQFTVQPVGINGQIKNGTCASGYCDNFPTANCNAGTWAVSSNTCREKDLIWLPYSFPGGLGDCSGAVWCSSSEGSSCTTEGAGCAAWCQSGVGAGGLICADKSCQVGFTGSTFTAICPTCNAGGITCPPLDYTTGGNCGELNLGAYFANTELNLACPGGCIGMVSATCDSSGAWTGMSNTCRQPNDCLGGLSGSGNTVCSYPSTTHGQTGAAGTCNKFGSCSVSCFDGTVSVSNSCKSGYCGDGICDSAGGENCLTCSDCACGSCSMCIQGSCSPALPVCLGQCVYCTGTPNPTQCYTTCQTNCYAAYSGCQ